MNERLTKLQEELARTESKYTTALREVDHRVKNNLQVIHAVIALEQRRAKDVEARLSFQNVMDRVTAVALAHDQLSLLQQGDELNLQDYLGALCATLTKEYAERITIFTA